jgi:hypothetical protein
MGHRATDLRSQPHRLTVTRLQRPGAGPDAGGHLRDGDRFVQMIEDIVLGEPDRCGYRGPGWLVQQVAVLVGGGEQEPVE